MKFLADTNLVSELIKERPNEAVMAWIQKNDPDFVLDTVIAAVALEHGLTVATRNTQDFPDVPAVNPWNNPA